MAAINWQDAIETVGGGGACLAIVAWLIKSVIADRLKANSDVEIERVKNALLKEAEAFKIQVKADADVEIERVKAFFIRASRVHERQLDILQNLYSHFYVAQAFFQRMIQGMWVGPGSQEECAGKVDTEMKSAHDELLKGRLFIPPELAQQCDSFFNAVYKGRLDFSSAHTPMLDAAEQTKLWNSVATVANEELPKILRQLDEAARMLIHGAL